MSSSFRFLLFSLLIMSLATIASQTPTVWDGTILGALLGGFNIPLYRWITAPDRVDPQQENLQS